uniref:Putative methyltransferase n=1 Tax=viral metagenome TaxID=1070528 RepID=A0A6M3ID74_9ZZZZ
MKENYTQNKYCRSIDLTNEASVESFFILRLLNDLGYEDNEIKTKKSIDSLRIGKGRKRGDLYKPDFVILGNKKPRWLIDAKGTGERIEDFIYQCSNYSLQIDQKYDENPLRFYMLTNGLLTRIYPWDKEEPVISLRFADFKNGNSRYEALKKLLSAANTRKGFSEIHKDEHSGGYILVKPSMDIIRKAFLKCHRIIWKSEKMSPQAAFVEFAKLLFVKLWEDRRLRDNPEFLALISNGDPLPKNEVRFSSHWIKSQEINTPNPIDSILFTQLVNFLEQEIEERKRKRIFIQTERLELSPSTVKRVVETLEKYYLFGIDEDLNGRMFEAFLTATMRGQALGQYFTPRSIVKLMARLSELKAHPDLIERVIDGCCGTGGFLIEALTEMRRQIHNNTSLTNSQRTKLLDEIANKAIFGIDAGKNPPITRIARINMYLHGDGGSRIYRTDALRNIPQASGADSPEIIQEVNELRSLFSETLFDVVLTNPPFSMDYSISVPDEKEVIENYELLTFGGKKRSSLRSSVMFIERYWKLLKEGGRLLTVIDDSVLAGKNYPFVRDFIRERFVIKAIISLHGDAFRRSGARAKTSILYMIKKHPNETQGACFVYESKYIGRDDVPPKTRPSDTEKARINAIDEIEEIVNAFQSFQKGQKDTWLVTPDKLNDRLDAKHLTPWSISELENNWEKIGVGSDTIVNLVDLIEDEVEIKPDERYTFLKVTYDGRAELGGKVLGKEVSYNKIFKAVKNDIIISNINAVNRAIAIMPSDLVSCLISPAFTIIRIKQAYQDKIDPMYIWSVLRSPAVSAEWLSHTTGFGRHYVDWQLIKKQRIPLLLFSKQKQIGDIYRTLLQYERDIIEKQNEAQNQISLLGLDDIRAIERLQKAKPPR